MSEIRANTISAANGTDPVTLTKQSAAKAWVRFNMSGTPSFIGSFNMASITDNGTGDQTLNFTNSFGASDFCSAGLDGNDNLLDEGITTSTIRLVSRDNSNTKTDSTRVNVQLCGDLA